MATVLYCVAHMFILWFMFNRHAFGWYMQLYQRQRCKMVASLKQEQSTSKREGKNTTLWYRVIKYCPETFIQFYYNSDLLTIVAHWLALLTYLRSVVNSNPFKGCRCCFGQITLLITGWYQEWIGPWLIYVNVHVLQSN